MNNHPKWRTTASKYIVNDRWLKLRADTCITPDGHLKDPFYIVEYPNWVNCFVIDKNGDAIMIRQYRHGIKEYCLEVVAGGIDQTDTGPEQAIRRELLEEIGYEGGELFMTGVSYANPAIQTNKNYSFLAVGGSCSSNQALEPGENIHIEKMPLKEAVRRMTHPDESGLIQTFHVACVYLALNFIKQSDNAVLGELKKKL